MRDQIPATDQKHAKYRRLLDRCKSFAPTSTAVAYPCDEASLKGAIEAAELGLLAPTLVGPREKIEAVAKQRTIGAKVCNLVTKVQLLT